MRLWLVPALCLIPLFALAADPNQAALAEAKSYLTACPSPGDEWRQNCLDQQRDFVDEYVRAKAGDPEAMGIVSAAFEKQTVRLFQQIGARVVADPVQECAWRLVKADYLPKTVARDDVHRSCDALVPSMREAAQRRAGTIEQELATHPARMPPPKRRLDSDPSPFTGG